MAQSSPNAPIHSSPRVNELISSLTTLDDVTFDRVMKRCCDPGRPIDTLKSILNAWNKIHKKKVKLGKSDEAMRGSDSGVDFLLASAKEDQIIAGVAELHARDYKEVCVASSVMSRPGQLYKSVSQYWRDLIKNGRVSQTHTGGENGSGTAAFVNTFNEVANEKQRKPSVEIIDLDTDSGSSSDGSEIRRRRINRRHSPSPRRRRHRSSRSRHDKKRQSRSRRRKHRSSSSSSEDSRPPKKHDKKHKAKRNRSEDKAKTSRKDKAKAKNDSKSQPRQSTSTKEDSEVKRYNNQLCHERIILTAEGLWTDDMEKNWMVMEVEETKLTKEYEELGKVLTAFPERHKKYSEEWMAFWLNKSSLIEEAGGDAQNYDYIPEWKEHWARRVEVLLRMDFNTKLDEIRKKYGVDFETVNGMRMKKAKMGLTAPASVAPRVSIQNEFAVEPLQVGKSTWRIGSNLDNQAGVSATPRPSPAPTPAREEAEAQLIVEGVGIDLVQALKRLTLLENELSFLAPKVAEFFEMAEQMEATGKGNSNLVLVNTEFLDLLSKCRFKLQALIQANVHPPVTLENLKYNVTSLDLILQSPKCKAMLPKSKKRRVQSPMEFADVDTAAKPIIPPPAPSFSGSGNAVRMNPEPPFVAVQPTPRPSGPDTSTEAGREEAEEIIFRRVEHLSLNKKVQIANLMTAALVTEGRVKISDADLVEFMLKAVGPLIRSVEGLASPSPSRDMSISPPIRPQSRDGSAFDSSEETERCNSDPEYENPIKQELTNGNRNGRGSYSSSPRSSPGDGNGNGGDDDDAWTGDMEERIIRNVSALPRLPTCGARAVTPPPGGLVFNYGHTTNRVRVDDGDNGEVLGPVAPRRNHDTRSEGRSGSSVDSPKLEVGELAGSDEGEDEGSGDLSYKRR